MVVPLDRSQVKCDAVAALPPFPMIKIFLEPITFDKNSNLNLQADFLMNDQYDTLTLLCVAEGTPDVFIELTRASNG